MNEADVRRVLLVRAFEAPPVVPPWSEGDAAWASREAARAAGESASAEQWIAARARLAAPRLAEREPAARAVLNATGGHHWIGGALVSAAFVAGLAADAASSSGRINILAPPLLALLVWNLAVYAAMLVHALRGRAVAGAAARSADGPLRRALAHAMQHVGALALPRAAATHPSTSTSALARYLAEWGRVGAPLQAARLARLLHWSAAALAAGALAGLYLRGLAFEYRASWDSTFLTPPAVHRLLAVVLGPASRLAGLPLPDVDTLARLRFSLGPGENAARWIHLHALTLAAIVLLPRALLAAWAARRARRYAERLPLQLDDAYFRRLVNARSGRPLAVRVLPYSYRVAPELQQGLRDFLERESGAPVAMSVSDPVAQDDDDAVEAMLAGAGAPAAVVALFALTATPERETHGEFLRALAAHQRAGSRLRVVIDESGFRKRFTGADAAARLAQRRAAWQRLLDDAGLTAEFVDLAAGAVPVEAHDIERGA